MRHLVPQKLGAAQFVSREEDLVHEVLLWVNLPNGVDAVGACLHLLVDNDAPALAQGNARHRGLARHGA